MFAYLTYAESQPQITLLSNSIIDKGETSQAQVVKWKDNHDCFSLNFVCINNQWYLILCNLHKCVIMNKNGTRQLGQFTVKKTIPDGKVAFFTSSCKAYEGTTAEEMLVVGNSVGELHYAEI